jgi:putative ABC transport system permease protein
MNLVELIRLALSRLGASRMRSALTMLGVIIGTAAVVALVSVGQGATAGITTQIESLGTNLLTISAGSTFSGITRLGSGTASSLTLDDAAAVSQIEGVVAVAPEVTTQQLVLAGDRNTTTTVVGTTGSYATVRTESVASGGFLNDASVQHSLRIAVIGSQTAGDLDLDETDLGSQISIRGLPFVVVGILDPKGGFGNFSPDDVIYIPLTVAQEQFVGGDSVRTISVSVNNQASIDQTKAAITAELRQRHGTTADTDDFNILDQSQLLAAFGTITTLLTVLLAGIASIALAVGGIGIMNIMLVSVRERTREIGIRKAVGARGRDILAQFLIEALALSSIGGAVGIVLGVAVSAIIGALAGWGLQLSAMTVVVAVGFSLLTGVVFGVWPARQAARLDPIAALRYE